MAFTAQYRRKREQKTNYRDRLVLLKSGKPRLVIRKSNKHMLVQLIQYKEDGDVVLKSAHTKELEKYGWDVSTRNIPSAYLVGYLLGLRAKGTECIVDLGLQRPIKGSRLFGAIKGAVDGGLIINVPDDVFPSEERILGKHISSYAKIKKEVFSNYFKKNKDPEKIEELFKKTKEAMQNG